MRGAVLFPQRISHEMAVTLTQGERHHGGGIRGFAGRQCFVHDDDAAHWLPRSRCVVRGV